MPATPAASTPAPSTPRSRAAAQGKVPRAPPCPRALAPQAASRLPCSRLRAHKLGQSRRRSCRRRPMGAPAGRWAGRRRPLPDGPRGRTWSRLRSGVEAAVGCSSRSSGGGGAALRCVGRGRGPAGHQPGTWGTRSSEAQRWPGVVARALRGRWPGGVKEGAPAAAPPRAWGGGRVRLGRYGPGLARCSVARGFQNPPIWYLYIQLQAWPASPTWQAPRRTCTPKAGLE